MKYRTLILMAIIVVILLAVVLLTGRKPEAKSIVSVEEIKKLRIERQTDTTEIEISNGGYRIVKPINYPADSSLVANLINSLKGLQLGEVISQREEKYDDFEVGEKGIRLIIKNKKDIAFILGKYAGDYQHSYLRFVDDRKVYLVKGINKFLIDRRPDDWRDKTILRIDRNLIERIVIDGEEIIKKDTLWFYGEQFLEKQKIDNILNLVSNLRASGFCDTATFIAKRQIKIFAGGEYTLEIGDKRDYNYLVKLPDKPAIFLISEYIVNNFLNLISVEEKEKIKHKT
ncbi:MAG: DUF4340 domain-containing protein [candidate division WOR-3 bacterium]